jgi:hypothetical protein
MEAFKGIAKKQEAVEKASANKIDHCPTPILF